MLDEVSHTMFQQSPLMSDRSQQNCSFDKFQLPLSDGEEAAPTVRVAVPSE